MKKLLFAFLFPCLVLAQNELDLALRFIDDKKYTQAENIIKPYVNSNANDIEALELLGDVYGYQENWDEAIEAYQELVNRNPNNANYQYKYGGVMAMKAKSVLKIRAVGLISDAKAAFLKAAELDSEHVDARWALVELYMQLPGIIGGSISKSLQYANQLEVISKVDGYLAKGGIYEYDDEPELAESYYIKAIKEGGSLLCYDKLTKFYIAQEEHEKAILNLKEAYKKHQDADLLLQIKALENDKM